LKARGRFTPEWIQTLKGAISLVDIVGENVELRKTGNRFMGRCPFHGDRSPSFSVNPQFYYCFGCKETGDAISFMMKLHGLSFEEACEDLAEKAKVPVPEGAGALSSEEERALFLRKQKIQKAARLNYFASLNFYHQNLVKSSASPLYQEARDYLTKRGITNETREKFQVGVAGHGHEGLLQFLNQAKAPLEIAREFGLIRPSQKQAGDYDFFRERLLFPLIDLRGRVCGFGGRILPSVEKRPSEMKLPKYLNSAESDLFQKSRFLYGLYQAKLAIREEEVAIVVEGYFDVISLHQAGIQNVVAPCGTSLTDEHLKMLSRLAKKIIVFFDQDEAGINATQKSMEMALKSGVLLYGIEFQSTLDPDEFLLEEPEGNLTRLKEWIAGASPLLDVSIERIFKESENDVEKRAQAIKTAAAWLTSYTDSVGRAVRVSHLLERWRVPPQALGALATGNPSIQTRPQSRPMSSGPARIQGPGAALGNGFAQAAPDGSRRRRPLPPTDRQLLQFFVRFGVFGKMFMLAKQQMHEKDTLPDLFDDTEVRTWVQGLVADPTGLQRLNHAPESAIQGEVSQELRSVIMEGLLQEKVAGEEAVLDGLLKRAVYKSWARFSHELKREMEAADQLQDMEKFKELSQQFLDLQRKLKEFEDSYVSGKTD
jgi:DNA primase